MKKYYLLLLVGFLFCLPNTSNAISGACSSHSGANCSYGADWDGSIVCNDGWRDSAVRYYDADECSNRTSQCLYPTAACTESQYSDLEIKAKRAISAAEGALAGSTAGAGMGIGSAGIAYVKSITNEYNLKLQACRNSINSYTQLTEEYNNCIEKERAQKQLMTDNLQKINEFIYQAEVDSLNKQNAVLSNNYCSANYGIYSYYSENQNSCVCNDGYVELNNKCKSYNEYCQFQQGQGSYGDKYGCYCAASFELNPDTKKCISKVNIAPETKTTVSRSITTVDEKLSSKLKGKILLQIEEKGQAYYVSPKDGKKYYMADGNKAYDVMRTLGVGITNKDLERIRNNTAFAKKSSGKIFLQVESKGEAYYIDSAGVAHYLKDGQAAYAIMRNLGLGITNVNLNKLAEGSF